MFVGHHNGFGARTRNSIEPLERRVLLNYYAIDPTFGVDGIAQADWGVANGFNNPLAVGKLADRKIVAVAAVGSGDPGALTGAAIARFNPDGTIDTSFGTGGAAIVPVAEALTDAAFDLDGRAVLVGHDGGNLIVARLTAEGQLDRSFAGDGIAEVVIASPSQTFAAVSVSVDGYSGIVASGVLRGGAGGGQLVLARLTPQGNLDTTFSGGGLLIDSSLPGSIACTDYSGRIYAVGADPITTDGRVTVARYTVKGTADPTFGQGGVVTMPAINPAGDVVGSVFADPESVMIGGKGFMALLREDGTPVTRFSDDGVVGVPAALGSFDTVLQLDGDQGSQPTGLTGSGLFRVDMTGALAPDFGSNGVVLFDGIRSAAINFPVYRAEEFVVAGRPLTGNAIAVARVNGQPDVTLAPSGILTVRAENLAHQHNTIALSAVGSEARLEIDGRISTYPLADVKGFDYAGIGHSVTLRIDIPATVLTGGGDDTIITADGDDDIVDRGGNNLITTGAGRDTIDAGDGNDTIVTGSGSDRVVAREGDDSITTGDGDDHIDVWHGNNTVTSNGGNDRIIGGDGHELIDAGPGNDHVAALDGNNTMFGGDGDDFVDALNGNDSITGGGGDDTLRAGNGDNIVGGGTGNDSIRSGDGRDTLWGEIGYDEIRAGRGDDYLNGGAGKDRLFGQQGDDTIYAGRNNDCIDGGPGRDLLKGGDGDDKLWDRDGEIDSLFGNIGDDVARVDDLLDSLLDVETLLS